jgi:hypothetical protein
MDESVRSFNEEQQRLAVVGGPAAALKRQLSTCLANLIAFGAIMSGLLAGLGALPQGPHGAIKLIYYGPVLTALACGAVLLLRRHVLDSIGLRPALWGLVTIAVIAVPAGLIDAAFLNGG